MSSAWQVRANRRNAEKSTGPVTAEGKARSALNAVTHGGYTTRLDHRADEPEFRRELEGFVRGFDADRDGLKELATTAFLNMKRLHRLLAQDDAAARSNGAAAILEFDVARSDEVDAAETLLIDEPRRACGLLLSTREGCDRLLDILTELEEALAFGRWDDRRRALLCGAAGNSPRSRDATLRAATDFLVRHQVAAPDVDRTERILDELLEDEPDAVDLPTPKTKPSLSERDLERFETAWTHVQNRIEWTRDNIEQIWDALEDEYQEARKLHAARAQTDFGPEGQALQRTLHHATRAFQKSFDQLRKEAALGVGAAPNRTEEEDFDLLSAPTDPSNVLGFPPFTGPEDLELEPEPEAVPEPRPTTARARNEPKSKTAERAVWEALEPETAFVAVSATPAVHRRE